MYLSARSSTANTKSVSAPRSLGLDSFGTLARLPPGVSPGSQTQPGAPQSHQPPPITLCPAKIGSDRQSMSKQTESSRLIVSSVPGLYQHLLSGAAGYQELGSRVLRQIEAANAFRQTEKVKELARILAHIPIREYQLASQYHLVLCKCRESEYPPMFWNHRRTGSDIQSKGADIERGIGSLSRQPRACFVLLQ